VVVINSTWYGQAQHHCTMTWLRDQPWDIAVLVCMIDAPIPHPEWFAEFGRPVIAVGSYKGAHHISLWAEVAARYIQPSTEHAIDLPFMCLNRKPHWHRVRLYQQLSEANLLEQGLVSMGGSDDLSPVRTVPEMITTNDLAPNGGKHYYGILNDIASLGDPTNWRRHLLNVVTETVFDVDDKYFVSEKIFKPLLGSRPFLLYAPGGGQQWLQDQRFETYIDDFQDITDLDLSDPVNMAPFLHTLCSQGSAYWKRKYLDLLPKIQYNLQRFNEFVSEQRQHIQQGITCPI
jgi:hypothetical protein